MRFRIWRGLLGAVLCLAASGIARAEDYRAARVSELRGNLAVRGEDEDDVSYVERNSVVREGDELWTDEDGRAEIELDRGSWLRLAEDTKIEARRLDNEAGFRLWTGSVFIEVGGRADRPFRLETPVGDVDVEPDSVVRVDLGEKDSARVSVFTGRARVYPDRGDPVAVREDRRVYMDADRPVEAAEPFDSRDRDGFDRYQFDRSEWITSRPLPRQLERDLPGARDLADNGEWVSVDNSSYWRPRVGPDWRPYSDGYWSDVPALGYTWIDYAPWGYTTSHYGSWTYRPVYGWMWAPAYTWAPAHVHWSNYEGHYGWAPLDPFGRPAVMGPGSGFNLTIGTGNFMIDVRSWTFCPQDRFFFGLHSRRFGGGPVLVSGAVLRPRPASFIVVKNVYRDFGVPRTRVRGFTTTIAGIPARQRVLVIENRMPRTRIVRIEQKFKINTVERRQRLVVASDVETIHKSGGRGFDRTRVLTGDAAEQKVRETRRRDDDRRAATVQNDRTARDRDDNRRDRDGNRANDTVRPNRDRTGNNADDRNNRNERDRDFRRGDRDRTGDDRPNRDRTGDDRPNRDRTGDDRPNRDRPNDRDRDFRRGEPRSGDRPANDRPMPRSGDDRRGGEPGATNRDRPNDRDRENRRREDEKKRREDEKKKKDKKDDKKDSSGSSSADR